MSTYVSVVISPATTTRPVVTSVSQATRPYGSCPSTASRIVSEIWSAILSGWPSVTDSEVKRNERPATSRRLPDGDEPLRRCDVAVDRSVEEHGPERRQVASGLRGERLLRARAGARAYARAQLVDQRQQLRHVRVQDPHGLIGQRRRCL